MTAESVGLATGSIAGYVEVARGIAAGDPRAVLVAVGALREPPEAVARALRAHHLVGFVRRALADLGATSTLDPAIVAALAAAQPVQRATPEELLALFVEVRGALAEVGIDVLLLKGLCFAERLYGGIDRRPQFDVDVLVRRRDARRARAVLAARGLRRTDYDLHSDTLVRGSAKVDIHRCLRDAPAFRLREDSLWAAARDVTIAGERVRTLADEHALVLLLLGLYEDLGQGMARLKQLVDLVRFLEDVDATLDWPTFFAQRTNENLLAISVNVLAVVLDGMAARARAPRVTAALAAYEGLVRHCDRSQALALLAAPRKDPANLAWFADVYPGSFAAYLARFWWGGFPANLRRFRAAWVVPSLRRALRIP